MCLCLCVFVCLCVCVFQHLQSYRARAVMAGRWVDSMLRWGITIIVSLPLPCPWTWTCTCHRSTMNKFSSDQFFFFPSTTMWVQQEEEPCVRSILIPSPPQQYQPLITTSPLFTSNTITSNRGCCLCVYTLLKLCTILAMIRFWRVPHPAPRQYALMGALDEPIYNWN